MIPSSPTYPPTCLFTYLPVVLQMLVYRGANRQRAEAARTEADKAALKKKAK